MKIFYALALPTVLASPGGKNGDNFLQSYIKNRVARHAKGPSYEDFTSCEGDSEDQDECMKTIFKKFHQMTGGKFPKQLKRDIKDILDGKSLDKYSTILESEDSDSDSFKGVLACSVPNLIFEPMNYVGPGPCLEDKYCRYNHSPWGECNDCPADNEECNFDGIFTVHDYKNCCNSCPNAKCDVEAFAKDLKQKRKMQNSCLEKPIPTVITGLRINPLDEFNLEDFMQWLDITIEDTRHFPGIADVEMNVEYKNPDRGVEKNTVFLILKWDKIETAYQYYDWRFFSGMWDEVDRWTGGQFANFWAGAGQVNTYSVWSLE